MKIKKIGMRTIKTGLAVTLALLVGNLFKLQSPFFAAIAAIIAIQTSVSESFIASRNRMYATIMGAIIALVFSFFPYIPQNNIFLIGIGTILIIYLCSLLKWNSAAQLATIVFLSIMLNYEVGSRLSYVLNRTLDTFVGLVVAVIVNYLIVPPDNEKKVIEVINIAKDNGIKSLYNILWDRNEFNEDLLLDDLENVNRWFTDYIRDRKYKHSYNNKDVDLISLQILLNNLSNDLIALNGIKSNHNINEYNKNKIREIFNKEIEGEFTDIDTTLDIVYNHHLKEALDCLEKIKERVGTINN